MRLSLFVLSLFVFLNLFSQTWNSNCDSTPVSERIFRNDVYKLAMHRLLDTNNPYQDSVEIPAIIRDSIARPLYAIYNMPSSLLRDSIMTYFGFSNFDSLPMYYPDFEQDSLHIQHGSLGGSYAPSIKRIYLYIKRDGSNPFADIDWEASNCCNTSNTAINQLMNQYGFTVQPSTSSLPTFTVTSPRAINTNAIGKKFLSLLVNGSITNIAEPYKYIGDGNSINMEYLSDGIMITFRKGCGDCLSGCTWIRLWKFKVNAYSDCSVTYVGSNNYYSFVPPPNGIYVCNRNGGSIVPVYFANIFGEVKDNQAKVFWNVATESNIKHYTVQRSFDGYNFSDVGRVNPHGNQGVNSYDWKDEIMLKIPTFYRIKAVEKDGNEIFSSTIILKPNELETAFTIFPNPIKGRQINIHCNNVIPAENYIFQVHTVEGKLLFEKKLPVVNSNSSFLLSLPHLVRGSYVLKMRSPRTNNLFQQLFYAD